MNKWYFKTFRIFDSPDKDVPEETAVEGVFDSFQGEAIVRAHNKIVEQLEAEIKQLKQDVKTAYGAFLK